MNHEEPTISRRLKEFMTVFDRIGFPAVAFGIMAYMCFVTLERNTRALMDIKNVLVGLTSTIEQHNRMAAPAIERILEK